MSDYLNSGYDMWRDHKAHYGVITARIMCLRYLDLQSNKTDPEEREFCRELREAMAMEPNLADKAVYRKSWNDAQRDGEVEQFNDSDMANKWCAGEINDAIRACEYGDGSHKLQPAVQALLEHCGPNRLSFVLAVEVRRRGASLSAENRAWAREFDIQNSFIGYDIGAYSIVLDEFITCLRETMDKRREAELTIYENGADYWRDMKEVTVSMEAALYNGGKYIDAIMRKECSANEIRFCRELFAAMYEDTAGTADYKKLVYPYDSQKAEERGETPYYQTSAKLNSDCAAAIDTAIHLSRFKPNQYNHALAAMKVVHDLGFNRVNLVLAHNVRQNQREDAFSASSKRWADGVGGTHGGGFADATLDTHPSLVDQFIRQTRILYGEVNAERFVLPGRAKSGEVYNGYEIVREISFDNQRGFAIGLNPVAQEQFATWQFTVENGKREYYWGNHSDDFTDAAANYIARVYDMMESTKTREIHGPVIAAASPEAPELNESGQNFAAWMAVTESSRYKWVEDEIYRLNGRGAMYYTGGENGVYMRIHKDGLLEAGDYMGAIPHIGEAMFQPAVKRQFDSFSDAYTAAMEAGGKRFMIDMFSGSEPQPLFQTSRGAAKEKPSVLKQIRDARKAPQPPRADKSPDQRKKKGDIDL